MVCRGFSDAIEGGAAALDRDDVVDGLGPYERLGASFQCDAHTSIASSSCRVDVKLALVKALRVRTENQPSI